MLYGRRGDNHIDTCLYEVEEDLGGNPYNKFCFFLTSHTLMKFFEILLVYNIYIHKKFIIRTVSPFT